MHTKGPREPTTQAQKGEHQKWELGYFLLKRPQLKTNSKNFWFYGTYWFNADPGPMGPFPGSQIKSAEFGGFAWNKTFLMWANPGFFCLFFHCKAFYSKD